MSDKYTQIGTNGKYEYGKDGTLYRCKYAQDKDGVTYKTRDVIANHTPILKEFRFIDNGFDQYEEAVFSLLRDFKQCKTITISKADITDNQPTQKFGLGYYTNIDCRGSNRMYKEALEIQCAEAKQVKIFAHTGFTDVDGQKVFLNRGYSVTAEGLTDAYNVDLENTIGNLPYGFINEKHKERYNVLLHDFFEIASEEIIYPSLGYAFVTPLVALLFEVQLVPRFVLDFYGKSQSGKTSFANLLLNFFGVFPWNTAGHANFDDTELSVGYKAAATDSTLFLVDDRLPNGTERISGSSKRMEQYIARSAGNRTGRSSMTQDHKQRQTPTPRCNYMVTGEEAFTDTGESGVARTLLVEILPTTFDKEKLVAIHDKAYCLNECMSEYIQYIIINWENIKNEIRDIYKTISNKVISTTWGRSGENITHLQIGIIYFCRWLVSVNQMSAADAAALQERTFSIFMELADRQNRRITEETPVNLFLNAVREIYESGRIRIKDLEGKESNTKGINVYNGNNMPLIGYKDSEYFYFFPKEIYTEVKNFYETQDKKLPGSRSTLYRQLEIAMIIEPGKDKDKTRPEKVKSLPDFPNGKRMLWVKSKFILDEGGEADEQGET